MASDKKVQQITAFNAGEYSDKLAGRVDIESFGHSVRLLSNFMAEPTGGVKKFYGTDFIAEIESPVQLVLVPFINNYDTMAFVIMTGGKVGLLRGNSYKDLDITVANVSNLKQLRWLQINDRLIFVHPDVQPFTIDFYGMQDNEPIFLPGSIQFTDVPYFPIGYTGEYAGELEADGIDQTVHLKIPEDQTEIPVQWPEPLATASDYDRRAENGGWIYEGLYYQDKGANCVCSPATIEVLRNRGGAQSTVVSVEVGVVNTSTKTFISIDENPDWNVSATGIMPYVSAVRPTPTVPSGDKTTAKERIDFYERISRERVAQMLKSTVFNKTRIENNALILAGDKFTDHEEGDTYTLRLTTSAMTVDGRVVHAVDGPFETAPVFVAVNEFDIENMVGRKIKIWMNTDNTITPWYQELKVEGTMIVYSNGHYYMNTTHGTCGNIQPSHLKGVVSDGGVSWRYIHSGSASATIIAATPKLLTAQLKDGEYLPILKLSENRFTTYQWSIWGKDGIHPAQIYMYSNRLGFVCNTQGYGAWNTLSCSDNYFDFSTEQYGQQYDTSAIVHLIPNNPNNKINWVLGFTQLYMGSYSGEFTIGSGKNVLTPTTVSVDRVSVLGGTDIMPLKYKELNLFVGSTGQELYTIGYDYTRDDYVPKSLGYLTEHLLEQGIARMEAINNRDQNVYLVHDNGNMSILNYVSDQQILGYSRVNLAGTVRDFCYTYSNQRRAGYVAVQRRDGYTCLEQVSLYNPQYILSGELLEFDGPVDEIRLPRFAGKRVYVINPDAQTFTLVNWPEDGVLRDSYDVERLLIGQEMVCELHSQPAFGRKMEGMQQQAIMLSVRLLESGAFEYGASNDFGMFVNYSNWGRTDAFGEWHKYFTGDAMLNIPTGYAKNANEGTGPYANTTGIGINIRATTPEPLNLLSIQEVYQ